MRTDQQGYLQRLGFRDADRNSSHHDMVCLFLADKKNSRKMAEYILDGSFHIGDIKIEISCPNHKKSIYYDVAYTIKNEKKLIKPEIKKYKDDINNLEASLKKAEEENIRMNGELKINDLIKYLRGEISNKKKAIEENEYYNEISILGIIIEVKTTKENITSVLQQLNTYRAFENDYFIRDINLRHNKEAWSGINYKFELGVCETMYVLVTTYEISDVEKNILESQGYTHINLNNVFDSNGKNYTNSYS